MSIQKKPPSLQYLTFNYLKDNTSPESRKNLESSDLQTAIENRTISKVQKLYRRKKRLNTQEELEFINAIGDGDVLRIKEMLNINQNLTKTINYRYDELAINEFNINENDFNEDVEYTKQDIYDIVKILINNGINVNKFWNLFPLPDAKFIKFLIDNEANVNFRIKLNGSWSRPLIYLFNIPINIQYSYSSNFSKLLDSIYNLEKSIKILIKNGANINYCDSKNYDVLKKALEFIDIIFTLRGFEPGNQEMLFDRIYMKKIFEYLIINGANINRLNIILSYPNETILDNTIKQYFRYKNEELFSIITAILKSPLNINISQENLLRLNQLVEESNDSDLKKEYTKKFKKTISKSLRSNSSTKRTLKSTISLNDKYTI